MTVRLEPVPPPSRAPAHHGAGSGPLFVFLGATLVMVLVVALVGHVDRWWVLLPVMLVDFALTFGVMTTITHLLADDGDSASGSR